MTPLLVIVNGHRLPTLYETRAEAGAAAARELRGQSGRSVEVLPYRPLRIEVTPDLVEPTVRVRRKQRSDKGVSRGPRAPTSTATARPDETSTAPPEEPVPAPVAATATAPAPAPRQKPPRRIRVELPDDTIITPTSTDP